MKINREQISGGILILFGIAVFAMVSQFVTPFSFSYPGSKALPAIAAFGFVVCGAGILINGCKQAGELEPFFTKEGWKRVGITMAVMALYVFLTSLVGYIITTPFAAFALTTLFAKGSESRLRTRIIYSMLLTAIIYVVYIYVFSLVLPSGSLF